MKVLFSFLFLLSSCGDSLPEIPQKKTEKSFALNSPDRRPLILVHGGGPSRIVSLKKIKQYFVEDGYAANNIHLPVYSYRKTIEEISDELQIQFAKIMKNYPRSTKFDVITHSLGNFVAMHALAEGGFSERVEKYIGLAGVARGQNKKPFICRISRCPEYMKKLAPFRNDFIEDFFNKHAKEIEEWDHCAIYSEQDRSVTSPRDSGEIIAGTGHLVTGMSHVAFARKSKTVELIQSLCYP